MQTHCGCVGVSWRWIPDSHGIDECVFVISFLKLGQRDVISEEVLFCEMSRHFDIKHLKLIHGVKVVVADEEPLGQNLFDDHPALLIRFNCFSIQGRELKSDIDWLVISSVLNTTSTDGFLH